jgi:hypothetical protein
MELFFDNKGMMLSRSQFVSNKREVLEAEINTLRTELQILREITDIAHAKLVREESKSRYGAGTLKTLLEYHKARTAHGKMYRNLKLAERVLLRLSY